MTPVIDVPGLTEEAGPVGRSTPATEGSTEAPARPRRGWRESIETGIYRNHRVACPSSADHRPRRSCGCPYAIAVPGSNPGATTLVTHPGPLRDAKRERLRRLAAGRPEPQRQAHDGTLHELATDHFRAISGRVAPSTLRGYEQAYLRSIAPHLGALPVPAINRERVEVWLAIILEEQGRHAAWKALSCLRPMLGRAVEWDRIQVNPALRLRLPRHTTAADHNGPAHGARRVLDVEQLGRLIAACGSTRVECMIRLSAEVGMRKGEMIGLRWSDVDLAARRVTITRTVWQARGGGGEKQVRPPKSGRIRRVAMPAGLTKRLAEWRTESMASAEKPIIDWVFPGNGGGPMDDASPNQALERAQRRAGLVDAQDRPLVTWHGLRHTSASVMIAAGAPITAVAAQLGHADPSITARIYSHLLDDAMLDSAVSAFDRPNPGSSLRRPLRGRQSRGENREAMRIPGIHAADF